ncbi:MAG: hypothetical protein SFV19_18645 [Rhodospirillaceae bacterium]|nr:hypothetical protein [Rhodospirillaceae bacterium]
MPEQTPRTPQDRRRLTMVGIVLGGVALFMYVSIIVKTAMMGP